MLGLFNNIRAMSAVMALAGAQYDIFNTKLEKMKNLSKLKNYGDVEKIEVGDTVHVIDIDGTEYTERVIEGIWYPYESKQTTLSIGHMRRDVFFTLYQLRTKKRELEAAQTTNKQIATRKIQGVVNTDRNNVQSNNKMFQIIKDLLYIDDRNGTRRVNLGNVDDADENFVFELFNKLKVKTLYVDSETGNVTISGVFSTGTEKEARTVVDKNGIQSYDKGGKKAGLWCNEMNEDGRRYADLTLYYNNQMIFQVYNAIDGVTLRAADGYILTRKNGINKGNGVWTFANGTSGSFQTFDGKTVTVSGGLITDIS